MSQIHCNFHSAVKVGLTGNAAFDDMDKAAIHKLKNKDYRIQQETPDHFTDDSGRELRNQES